MRGRILALLALAHTPHAFYLPGVSPHEYLESEPVELRVNKLSSVNTQLPYDYYSLPFCKPDEMMHKIENLGEVLPGAMIQNTLYQLRMGVNESKAVCRMVYLTDVMKLFAAKVR